MKKHLMQIALYQPDIPQNLGSIIRLCACMNTPCHIIEPCGFILDDKRMKRVAMDYAEQLTPQRHTSWKTFREYTHTHKLRIILLTTKAQMSCYDFAFRPSDILLLGRESAGVPADVASATDAQLRIPLSPTARSLNIAQAASMALGESLRQTQWNTPQN